MKKKNEEKQEEKEEKEPDKWTENENKIAARLEELFAKLTPEQKKRKNLCFFPIHVLSNF